MDILRENEEIFFVCSLVKSPKFYREYMFCGGRGGVELGNLLNLLSGLNFLKQRS